MTSRAWLELLAAVPPGSRLWADALRESGGAEALLGLRGPALTALGISRDEQRRLASVDHSRVAGWQRWLEAPGHHLVPLGGSAYPDRLAELPDAPLALWVRSRCPDALLDPQVAVVGSRNPSAGGRVTAMRFARALSASGLGVTSGLAAGIDAASHEGALAGPGRTVAVLGSGIDIVYPASHEPLADRIAAAGALVSEYAPGTPTRSHQFPRRNRIIAGLALGTLVIEAARRSGSLITARCSVEYGREVFAVPGSIHSALSKGCHRLLRDGAKLVEEVGDILVEIAPALAAALPPPAVEAASETPSAAPSRAPISRAIAASEEPDERRRRVLERLDFAPVTLAELLPDVGLTAAELSSMLLHLEMEGSVEALPGGRYCRQAKRG